MTKIVLYWAPGSCGDLVQAVMSCKKMMSLGQSFAVNDQGKIIFEKNQTFQKLFPCDGYWYQRDWNNTDIKQLEKIDNIIIGTHRLDQVEFIKSSGLVTTIGITYDESLFPAVLKNWCKKIATQDPEIEQVYQKINPKLVDLFKNKNRFGEFILSEQLKYGISDYIPRKIDPIFDINLRLGDIYNQNLSAISRWLTNDSYSIFSKWYQAQDNLYKFKFDVTEQYIEIFGYNFQATTLNTQDLPLSSYDEVLLRHYCKNKNLEKVKATTNIKAVKLLG
jgi:hypothetical protein